MTMGPRLFRILIILAGIMGADGVILAAASAHQPDATRLASASSMLLFHATAVLAVVALTERGLIHVRIGIASAFGFVVAALHTLATDRSVDEPPNSLPPRGSFALKLNSNPVYVFFIFGSLVSTLATAC